jgi:hypothetical protein
VKGLTIALGAVVAASALVYLNPEEIPEGADLVAPLQQQRGASVEIPGSAEPSKSVAASRNASVEKTDDLDERIPRDRDRAASLAKTNLFRVLEVPAVVVPPPPAPPVERVPAVTPTPTFSFLGSFNAGAELQAIVQIGEIVELIKPNQIVTGFRIDSIDSGSLGWTHEPTATKGLLRARVIK